MESIHSPFWFLRSGRCAPAPSRRLLAVPRARDPRRRNRRARGSPREPRARLTEPRRRRRGQSPVPAPGPRPRAGLLRGGRWPGGGMRLLFLAVLRPHTGNAVTAQRIRDHLEAAGHVCILKDALDYDSQSEVAELIRAEDVEAALALHAYRAGRFLQGHGIPFGIVFGGTDLNEDVTQGEKHRVMGRVLEEARFAVAFTEPMKAAAGLQWPHAKDKIHVQTQGIATLPSTAFCWDAFLQSAEIASCAGDAHVFLLICGLRQVKDPLYLVDAFSEWHRQEPDVYLVIVGPEVDPVFTREVKAKVKSSSGVRLAREMPQGDLHAALGHCVALVNSSVSEGMSAAILEAMELEVPVLARNIPGNAAVVQHGATGLLFSNPQEFVHLAKRLVSDPTLARDLGASGRAYVRAHHAWQAERDTYQHLIQSLKEDACHRACS